MRLRPFDRPWAAEIGWRLARIGAFNKRPTVHYVTDNAGWSFDWDGRYITEGLRRQYGQSARTVFRAAGLRGEIVHFGSRYAFLNAASRRLSWLNRVFLTWFHGDPKDAAMAPLFEALQKKESQAERIIVPCRLTEESLLAIGIAADKIVRVPLGVELGRFHPAPIDGKSRARRALDVPDDAIVVGSFQKDGVGWGDGREPKLVKGPDVFLEAVASLARSEPRLFVLLTGPARGFVKAGLEKIGVPYRHVELAHYWDIVRCYQALDLYIISSRCEGGPKALLESWACGVPIVTTRVGMCADLVEDGVNGVLVESGDEAGLADGARSLIGDLALRDRTVAGGLGAVADYSWDRVVDRYMSDVYGPVLFADPGRSDQATSAPSRAAEGGGECE